MTYMLHDDNTRCMYMFHKLAASIHTYVCPYEMIYTSRHTTKWWKIRAINQNKRKSHEKRVLIHFVGFIFSQYISNWNRISYTLYIYIRRAIYFPIFFCSTLVLRTHSMRYIFFFILFSGEGGLTE